jgi:hypothetical protein
MKIQRLNQDRLGNKLFIEPGFIVRESYSHKIHYLLIPMFIPALDNSKFALVPSRLLGRLRIG